MIPRSLRPALVALALGLTLAGCGVKGPLDTPVERRQAIPGTIEDKAARNPPKGKDGKPVSPPTMPGPRPTSQSFPLDFLLN